MFSSKRCIFFVYILREILDNDLTVKNNSHSKNAVKLEDASDLLVEVQMVMEIKVADECKLALIRKIIS